VLAALLAPAPAHASKLVTIGTPSRFVDARKANFSVAGPHKLQANVLLPDGYDPKRRYPLLLLLHGAGERWDSWARADRGNIAQTAKGLDAIIVMPEGAVGFYTNWWNGGRRGDPQWERYIFDELLPLIERRYPIRAARRYHAIAGFSMAGLGSSLLATQRPGYFGSAAPFSGFVSVQRPENDIGLSFFSGVDYQQIFGPPAGFYAAGHNPVALARNLQYTRMFVASGNGIPQPGVDADLTDILSGSLEAFLLDQNREFVDALRKAGATVTFRTHLGNHSFPYWREDLKAFIASNPFAAVQSAPSKWTFSTVAQQGEAWGLKFAFARPPDRVVTLRREGAELVGEGAGEITVRDSRECTFSAGLPFRRLLSGRLCRSLRIKLAPRVLRAGETRRVGVEVTTIQSGRRVAARGARVRLGSRVARADSRGRTAFVVTAGPAGQTLVVKAAKDGSRSTFARLRVR
jgi:S-formylglutathione hydrolase FrmB